MRIVNISYSTSDLPFGTEKVARFYVDLFLERGHDILFIYRHDYDIAGLDTNHPKLTLHRITDRTWWQILKGRFVVAQFAPDIAVVHNHFSRFLLSAKFICPMIGIAHLAKFKSLKHYEGTVALNSFDAESAKVTGIRNLATIENTVPLPPEAPLRKTFRTPPVIGGMGSLTKGKEFSVLLEALKILKDRDILFKMVLAGAGGDEDQLRQQVIDLGLEQEVTFLGYVHDIEFFYNQIDIFCTPSARETSSLVFLDALFRGCPVVVSDIPAFKIGTEEGKWGTLFPVSSVIDLASALQKIIHNPSPFLEQAKQAQQHFRQHRHPSKMAEKLENFMMQTTQLKSKR